MRDISEMDSVGRRGMTGTGSVEERKSNVTSTALGISGRGALFFNLSLMLPIFLPQNTPILA